MKKRVWEGTRRETATIHARGLLHPRSVNKQSLLSYSPHMWPSERIFLSLVSVSEANQYPKLIHPSSFVVLKVY